MKVRRLVNRTEEVVGDRLKKVCDDHGSKIYSKIRVADVLEIAGSGISDEEYSYALAAHFDFVVADEDHMPLFAVEYDGPMHSTSRQMKRDAMKNHLCERFSLPLLRVRSAHLGMNKDGWDLLSWFVDVWFLSRASETQGEQGYLPSDYHFDPALVVSHPGRQRRFPYWLGLNSQLKLKRLSEQGLVYDEVPWILFQGEDVNGNRRGFGAIRIDPTHGVVARVGMRQQSFGIGLHDVVQGVLLDDLLHQAEAVLKGTQKPVSTDQIDREFRECQATLKMLSCFSGT